MSRIPPGLRIHEPFSGMDHLDRLSDEHYGHHNAYSTFIDGGTLNFYTAPLGEVTMVNRLFNQFPDSVFRGTPSLGFGSQTLYVNSENPLTTFPSVTIEGLSASGDYQTATARLNGVTPVQIGDPLSWAIVNRGWQLPSLAQNTTPIWIHSDPNPSEGGVPGRPQNQRRLGCIPTIEIGGAEPWNETPLCYYMVPNGQKTLVLGWSGGFIGQGNNKVRHGQAYLQTRKFAGVGANFQFYPWRTRALIGWSSTGVNGFERKFITPLALDPQEEIRLRFWADGNVITRGNIPMLHEIER